MKIALPKIKIPKIRLRKPKFLQKKIKKANNVVIGFDRDMTKCRIMRIMGGDVTTASVEERDCKPRRADATLFSMLSENLKKQAEEKAGGQSSAAYLVLPDRAVCIDRISVPTMKTNKMKAALVTDYNSVYKNHKELRMISSVASKGKSNTQFSVVSVQKNLLTGLNKSLAESKFYSKDTTFASNATINAVLYLRPKYRGRSFFFVDVKEDYSTLIMVASGKTAGFLTIPYGRDLLEKTSVQYEPMLADHPEGELAVANAKAKAKSHPGAVQTQPETEQLTTDDVMFSGKSQKRIPKFLQRPIPATKEGIPMENFRIILKWIMLCVRQNRLSETLENPEFVVVNVPSEYNYVIEALNSDEEKEENGIEFRPFYPETEKVKDVTDNLDLFGGLLMQVFNKQNNF